MSKKGGNSCSSSIYLTPSREELVSKSDDELEMESSPVLSQASQLALDSLSSWWCVDGMREIYTEGM